MDKSEAERIEQKFAAKDGPQPNEVEVTERYRDRHGNSRMVFVADGQSYDTPTSEWVDAEEGA